MIKYFVTVKQPNTIKIYCSHRSTVLYPIHKENATIEELSLMLDGAIEAFRALSSLNKNIFIIECLHHDSVEEELEETHAIEEYVVSDEFTKLLNNHTSTTFRDLYNLILSMHLKVGEEEMNRLKQIMILEGV